MFIVDMRLPIRWRMAIRARHMLYRRSFSELFGEVPF